MHSWDNADSIDLIAVLINQARLSPECVAEPNLIILSTLRGSINREIYADPLQPFPSSARKLSA